jgi:hypothetical protein
MADTTFTIGAEVSRADGFCGEVQHLPPVDIDHARQIDHRRPTVIPSPVESRGRPRGCGRSKGRLC